MIRLTVFATAVGIVSLAPPALAQSPNPALLAPSGGRAGLAPSHRAATDSYLSEARRDTSKHEVSAWTPPINSARSRTSMKASGRSCRVHQVA
jgi:hypothetical protein